jgi:hypothetical protein
MPPLAQDIRSARKAVERVLKEIGVRGFVYTVEQKEAGWVLSVECATDGGWQTLSWRVDPAELNASLGDSAVRAKLRADWEPRLRACAVRRKAPRTTPRGA